jgi:hypothetical protein
MLTSKPLFNQAVFNLYPIQLLKHRMGDIPQKNEGCGGMNKIKGKTLYVCRQEHRPRKVLLIHYSK